METSVTKIVLNKTKHQVTVRFFDEIAHFHQSCEVIVFVDNDPAISLGNVQDEAIQSAKKFLSQCQG